MTFHRSFSRGALRTQSLRKLPFAVLALVGVGISCQTRATEVLARLGGTEVTVEEVRDYLETLGGREQAAVAKDPALLSQVVRSYLTRQAVIREALTKKYDQQPGIKARLDRARNEALAELYLDSMSRSPESYPSDAQVQAAYDANKTAFETPRQYRLAQIYVALPKGVDKAGEEKAHRRLDEIVRKLKQKGTDFATIARGESDDKQTAPQGGEIGWLPEAKMVAGIRTAATALPKDAVSDPVRLDDGWHVLKLLETRPAGVKPLVDVRGAIVEQLRAGRSRELRQAFVAKLLEQNALAVNELALSTVVIKGK